MRAVSLGEKKREQLAAPVRVTACAGVTVWLGLAAQLVWDAYQMATFTAGPNDHAAHGMVPADLQMNVLGMVFIVPSAAALLACLVLMVLIARGIGAAVYVGCAFAPLLVAWSFFALLQPTEHVELLAALTLCASALVIGSALAHGFRNQLEGRRWSASGQALAIVGVVELAALLVVGVAAIQANKFALTKSAERQQQQTEERRRKLADQQRVAAAAPPPVRLMAPQKPEERAWNHVASPIVDLELDTMGRTLTTLHGDGTVRSWSTVVYGAAMVGEDLPGSQSALIREIGPFPGDSHVTLTYRSLLAFVSPALLAATSAPPRCAQHDPPTSLEPLRWPSLAIGGRAPCLGSAFTGEPVTQIAVPGCSRVTGLHASGSGTELLVQCPRFVAVLNTVTKRIRYRVATDNLLPGSARVTGPGYAGIVADGNGYSAIFGTFDLPGSKRVALGRSARPPQLELTGFGDFVVAGAGVCVYRSTEAEPRCPVARDVPVRKLALPRSLTHRAYERDDSGKASIRLDALRSRHPVAGFVLLDRAETPLMPISLE